MHGLTRGLAQVEEMRTRLCRHVHPLPDQRAKAEKANAEPVTAILWVLLQ